MTMQRHAVQINKTIAAPPASVYRAWLDPELVQRWMVPGDFTASRVEIDARPGGHFGVWHSLGGVDAGGFECEFIELEENRRLVFRWGFVGPDRLDGPIFDSLLTVTLRETDTGSTALTLIHERLEDLARVMPDAADMVGPGWDEVLDTLAKIAGT
jgi:uncharacterized protein YndB with AHSA1/START domain